MKLWTQTQIFFIYDTKFCSREEDDPRDAILYFHPTQMPDSLRCALCGQLMGLAQFSSAIFSPPTLIRLQRSKFALKAIGKYTLALSGSLGMPDPVLRRQLQALYEMFVFYHDSIDSLSEKCENKLAYVKKLSDIFECYLPVSQHFGNTHSLTFSVLPSLDLPKSAGSLFLQASHILQSCQVRSGVIAGCLLSKNQIVCSQLPPTIVRNFCFISSTHPQLPAEELLSDFKSPAGAKRVLVYLTSAQLNEIYIYNNIDFAGGSSSGDQNRRPTTYTAETKCRSSSDSTKYYTESSSESEPSRPVTLKQNAAYKLSNSLHRSNSAVYVKGRSNSLSERSSLSLRSSRSFESLSSESLSSSDKESVTKSLKNWRSQLGKFNATIPSRPSKLLLNKFDDGVCNSSVQAGSKRANHWNDNVLSNNSPKTCTTLEHSSAFCRVNRCPGSDRQVHRFSVYIQGHSESQLILLMDEDAANNPDTINHVWKVGLSSLVDLEIDINNCVERSPKKEPSSNYLYVQYDRVWNTLRGDLASTLPASSSEQLFSRTVQLSHEALTDDPLLQEISLRFGNTVVYSHCLGSTETHLQQQLQPTSEYSLLSSDIIAAIGDQAKKRLEQDHGVVLL